MSSALANRRNNSNSMPMSRQNSVSIYKQATLETSPSRKRNFRIGMMTPSHKKKKDTQEDTLKRLNALNLIIKPTMDK
jgi:hypothetical protein